VLDFAAELEKRKIWYQVMVVRPTAVMFELHVPGERIEVEFMDDGEIEVERFRSNGHMDVYTSVLDLLPLLDQFD
jgi:hypothetical protein